MSFPTQKDQSLSKDVRITKWDKVLIENFDPIMGKNFLGDQNSFINNI
jgi:hypothetical protein